MNQTSNANQIQEISKPLRLEKLESINPFGNCTEGNSFTQMAKKSVFAIGKQNPFEIAYYLRKMQDILPNMEKETSNNPILSEIRELLDNLPIAIETKTREIINNTYN